MHIAHFLNAVAFTDRRDVQAEMKTPNKKKFALLKIRFFFDFF